MADTGRVLKNLFALALLGATALGLLNVFSDNSEVLHMAEREACAQLKCNARQTRMMRTPIGQSYTFQVEIKEGTNRAPHSVDVDCRREYYLFGEYHCKRLND